MMKITLFALVFLLSACGSNDAQRQDEEVPANKVIRVTGELRSSNSIYFAPPSVDDVWNFTIAYMVPDGSRVKAGQPVLKFNTNELDNKLRDKANKRNEKQKELEKQEIVSRETLAELKLALEESRAARDKAALKADIPESLLARRDFLENQLILELAGIDVDLRQAELEKETRLRETEELILQRELAVLDADIARLQASIDAMTRFAPVDGVVIHVSSRRHSKPTVGDQVWRGRRIMELPDLENLEVLLEIPERESARVAVDQKVGFALDAAPDKSFSGTITSLASVIRTKSRKQPARVFDATVRLENPDPDLMRPGMSVTAQIDLDSGSTGP